MGLAAVLSSSRVVYIDNLIPRRCTLSILLLLLSDKSSLDGIGFWSIVSIKRIPRTKSPFLGNPTLASMILLQDGVLLDFIVLEKKVTKCSFWVEVG